MNVSELYRLFDQHKCTILSWRMKCHDCGEMTEVTAEIIDLETGAIKIEGGSLYSYSDNNLKETKYFIKCTKCYEKDPVLRNFKPCEVYSRVVGYLRPTSQWNPGKREEFKERVAYDTEKAVRGIEK